MVRTFGGVEVVLVGGAQAIVGTVALYAGAYRRGCPLPLETLVMESMSAAVCGS